LDYSAENIACAPRRGQILSWCIYDFANTIYSMNVVSLYFPLLVIVNLGFPDIYVSVANSISMLIVALTAPLLGQLTDRIGRRKEFLLAVTTISCLATAAIGVFYNSLGGHIFGLLAVFVAANVAYQLGLVFYNSLLPSVAPPGKIGRIGGLGVAIGYIGSIVGMILVLPFNEGAVFGLEIPFIQAGGRPATFLPTAILFALFSLPTFLFLKEKRQAPLPKTGQTSFAQIIETLKDTKKYPGIRRFLISKLFFEEGIETAILFMGVYSEKAIGLGDDKKIPFFVIATVFAAIGSWLFGKIVDRWGAKPTLMAVLLGWVASLFALIFITSVEAYFVLGAIVGVFLGGAWTAARPMLIELSPKENIGRFFGLYSLSGKTAAIIGPLFWGIAVWSLSGFGNAVAYRGAVCTLAVMIAIGAIILHPLKKVIV